MSYSRQRRGSSQCILTRIRHQHVLPGQDLEVVMRFFSYYYDMREVAVELTGMAERAALLGDV